MPMESLRDNERGVMTHSHSTREKINEPGEWEVNGKRVQRRGGFTRKWL